MLGVEVVAPLPELVLHHRHRPEHRVRLHLAQAERVVQGEGHVVVVEQRLAGAELLVPLTRRVNGEVGIQHAVLVGAAEVLQDAAELRLYRAVHPAVLARHPVDAPAHPHRESGEVEQVARAASVGPRLAVGELALEGGQHLVQLLEVVRHLQPEIVQQVAADVGYRTVEQLERVELRHVVHCAVDERLLGVGHRFDLLPQRRGLGLHRFVERQDTPASAKSFTWRWVMRMMSGSWAVPSSSCTLALKSPPGIASICRSMLLVLADRLIHRRIRVDRRRRVLRPHEGDGDPFGSRCAAFLLAGGPRRTGNEQQGQSCRN